MHARIDSTGNANTTHAYTRSSFAGDTIIGNLLILGRGGLNANASIDDACKSGGYVSITVGDINAHQRIWGKQKRWRDRVQDDAACTADGAYRAECGSRRFGKRSC